MRLENHIALRFLTDDSLAMEIVMEMHPNLYEHVDLFNEAPPEAAVFYQFINKENQTAYYLTDTMLDSLDDLKVTKKDDRYNWTVFKNIQDKKVTFIMRDNVVLRVQFRENQILFCHMTMRPDKTKQNYGTAHWIIFHVNRETGLECDHFASDDVKGVEHFIYALLCFMYLTDNDELILPAGAKHGTKKSGKIINKLPIPLTIVTSRWNTTVINNNSFGVRGHFRLQACGVGMQDHKLIFIDPFVKNGYVRRAQNELEEDK